MFDESAVVPITHGPTFERNPDTGRYRLPERTIGPYVVDWIQRNLVFPDGDHAGQPITLTAEQQRFIWHMYELDENDRFRYTDIAMVRIKGADKSGMAAKLSLVEFIGPCRPARTAEGYLIAVPHPKPFVQIAAVNQEQTNNTFAYFSGLMTEELMERYGVDLGRELAYSAKGGKLKAVTSSPRALEGARPSFVVMEETHLWIAGATNGPRMREVISRNLAKDPTGQARSLQVSNQFDPTENSVLQSTWEDWVAFKGGRSADTGLMFDSIEAPPDLDITDPAQLRAGINAAKGDAHWLDTDRVVREVMKTSIAVSVNRRFWLNQQVASEDSFIRPQDWHACKVDDKLKPGDSITLGLDASISDDHTALVACRLDGFIQIIWSWSPDKRRTDQGFVEKLPRDELDAAVRHAFERYDVRAFFADPPFIESHILQWNADFGRDLEVKASGRDPISFYTGGRKQEMARATERFESAITTQHIKHNGDENLTWYVLNARRRPNRWGFDVAKASPDSPRKIDALISSILAYQALAEISNSTRKVKTPGFYIPLG